MNKLEKLLEQRDRLNAKIFVLENQSGKESDYSTYVNKYYDYLDESILVKHWIGSKFDDNCSYFEVVVVTDNSITLEHRELWFMSMEEITKEDFDTAFNTTLNLLKK